MEYESVPQTEFEKQAVDSSLLGDAQKNFAKKVFSIVGTQLMFTAIIVYCSIQFKFIETFCEQFFIHAIICSLILGLLLTFSKSSARKFPLNFILLSVFTLCEAIILTFSCAQIGDPEIVFQAFIITTMIVVALATYAMTTKNDITYYGAAFFLLLFGSVMASITYIFFGNQFAYLIYLIGGAIILGFYLVYDIQLIIGNQKLRLTVDDYILGSILLYTDIIKIFLRILEILMKFKNEK
ncbi:unnamed protein product [Paramecium sonneborni]|uniref:Uncharacterized protein n=1 Tax=Paramecium sonneborni TaxID=65129 RepID=A0A8S1NC29_9CILI|nr:unnamed protein product [Paramecium sonneborni]